MSSHTPDTLRTGYSTRTKLAVTAAACVAWIFTVLIVVAGAVPALGGLLGVFALVASALAVVTFRSGYAVTIGSLRHTTWRGESFHLRSAFLGVESMEDNRGNPALLLRFESGVVFLSDSAGCSDPQSVQQFVERHWQVAATQRLRPPTGPVLDNLVLQYESLHLALLALATLGLAGLAALGPMFWASAVLAFFTGRAFHRMYSCQRIATDHEGLTVTRPLQPQLKIRWDKVTSVRYWYSLAHGGMILSDGKNTIRVYRWIQNYPRFNRLVQDSVPAPSFPPPRSLPWKISLNRRQQSSWLVLLGTAGISVWLILKGAWPAALILLAVPSVTFLFTILASGRRLEIHADKMRLVEKKRFRKTTREYLRSDLEDIRLGRQISAGGLWMKFGNARLEIGNLDCECAPEEILATLRREWRSGNAQQAA
jgi:hypothetical protein